MRLCTCYTLMQLPSTVLVVLALYFMMDAGWLSELSAALILCAWLLKDVVLYPRFRETMRKGPPIKDEALAGYSTPTGAAAIEAECIRRRDGEHLTQGVAGQASGVNGPVLQMESQVHEIRSERRTKVYPEHSDPNSESAA